ncbi:hypothetical protein LY76DRAFT_596223 [Colletotrichum caudatum]|nr:hypothetical protein LY76DRAFT_596223 [Colletotrichum caudatum]
MPMALFFSFFLLFFSSSFFFLLHSLASSSLQWAILRTTLSGVRRRRTLRVGETLH